MSIVLYNVVVTQAEYFQFEFLVIGSKKKEEWRICEVDNIVLK